VRAVIDVSMALGQVICVTDPAEAAARDAAMRPQAGAPQPVPALPGVTTGVVRAGDPVAGRLFVQGRVPADGAEGGPARFDDVAGAGWRLVTTVPPAAALPADLDAWFAGIGGRVVPVAGADDVDGTYARWAAEHGVVAALQRPDFHLYGAAADEAGVTPLLADLRAALGPTTTTGGPP